MKNNALNIFLLLALVGLLSTSCKKEYAKPPIDDLPVGTVYTIDSLVKMGSHDFTGEDASVYGIITADEQSGNLYKAAFMQDRATGAAIELYLDAVSGVRIGDSVRVYLRDVTLALYNGLPQLSGFGPDGHIIILANNKPITPALTSISEIKTGRFLGGLVRLENVWFTERTSFAEPNTYGNRYLVDEQNPFIDDQTNAKFVVRTSNYANFANNPLPSDTGNLVAIASLYRDTWQLIIRSFKELEFHNFTPGGGGQSGEPGEVQSLPYYQSFSGGFGTYMSYSIIDDNHVWQIEKTYGAVVMTGHVQNGSEHTYYENEDWLISSPVAITDVSAAKMMMTYIGRYFNNINNDVTIWASSNYEYGTNPTSATWTQIPANLTTSNSWSDTKTTELSLTQFVGQTVSVAVKYVSTNETAGTMEVMNIMIQEGEAGGDAPTPPTPGPGEGSGTQEDPYNVASGITLQNQEVIGWTKGYIVGAANAETSVTSASDVDWAAPFTKATNVLIADDPNCREISQCIIVNLPSNKPLRAQVNLLDHPENLGKMLAVNGKLRTYFGQAGLRDSGGTEADFVLEGGDTPTPPTPGETIFSETFANGQGDFTVQDVVRPDQLDYVWTHDADYTCMKASAFVGQCYVAESWLVSPVIALPTASEATLSIDHAVNKATPTGALFVMVSTDYNGDVTSATWTELNLSQWPAGNNWTFVTNATADLTPFVGQNVTIAFKYTSTSSASATWEIRNFVVKE